MRRRSDGGTWICQSLAAADRRLFVKAWYYVTGWFGEAVTVLFVLSGYLVGGVACAKASFGRFTPIFTPSITLAAFFAFYGEPFTVFT
jgi:hypothetical protein